MSLPTRATMRLLSPRLQCLYRPHPSTAQQLRSVSSRYSSPTKRAFTDTSSDQSSVLSASNQVQYHESGQGALPDDAKTLEEKRQYHLRRMRFAGMGLLLSLTGLTLLLYNLDLDDMDKSEQKRRNGYQLDASDESKASFQGKQIHVIGAGEDKRIVAQGSGEEVELVETGTSSVPHFPRTIYLPTLSDSPDLAGTQPNAPGNPGNIGNKEQYTLVGLGIRTVMWIQVYVVGLYVRTQDISAMQEKLIHHVNTVASTLVPAEKEELRKKLLDPQSSKEIWTELLKVPGMKTAWRISPTRNTDFKHLRDGFVTGINKRTQEARQTAPDPNVSNEYDAEDFGDAVQAFKGIFTGGNAPKGSILIMARDKMGGLDVLYQAKPENGRNSEMEKLGSVADERVGRLIWLGYLGGDKVSSEATRKGVVEGCVGFAGRPVGSVETMVT